jgi:HPt (histidine-containing phosphotransfer) domain-containing protein
MTANATVEDRDQSLDAGMNAHISKPIDPKELFGTLLTWVKPGKRQPVTRMTPKQEVTTAGAPLPLMAGIDTEAGIARLAGNVDSYRRLLRKFAGNQAGAVSEIREAISQQDQELAVRLAHSLKGASGALGAVEVQNVAAEIETILKSDLKALADGQLDSLASTLQAAITAINTTLEAGNDQEEPGKAGALPADFVEKLLALKDQLDEYDSESEETIEALLPQADGTSQAAALARVHRSISAYELDEAADQLQRIITELENSDGG